MATEQVVQVPSVYGQFKILTNPGEESSSERMPKNVAQAVLLFHQTQGLSQAVKLHECMEKVLNILAKGPDGKTKFNIGKGCICWSCGFIGIPTNSEEIEASPTQFIPPQCQICKMSDDTNFVQGEQPDGTLLPFIEAVSA